MHAKCAIYNSSCFDLKSWAIGQASCSSKIPITPILLGVTTEADLDKPAPFSKSRLSPVRLLSVLSRIDGKHRPQEAGSCMNRTRPTSQYISVPSDLQEEMWDKWGRGRHNWVVWQPRIPAQIWGNCLFLAEVHSRIDGHME